MTLLLEARSPVIEFYKVIPMLTDPARFGGDPADAFTVVAPSLPGYVFSFKPGQKRFSIEEIADVFATLMSDVLGYPRFACISFGPCPVSFSVLQIYGAGLPAYVVDPGSISF